MPFKKGNTYSKGRGRGLGNRSSEDLHQSTTSRLLLHQDVDQTAAQAKPWKPQSVDCGLPFVYGRDDVKYIKCSDEH
ncbi:MAG: hypothetical protein WAL37_15870, partial [Xanthobacteraceae bacterium]